MPEERLRVVAVIDLKLYDARGGRIATGGGLFAGGPLAAGLIAGGLFASGLNAANQTFAYSVTGCHDPSVRLLCSKSVK